MRFSDHVSLKREFIQSAEERDVTVTPTGYCEFNLTGSHMNVHKVAMEVSECMGLFVHCDETDTEGVYAARLTSQDFYEVNEGIFNTLDDA